MSQLGESYKSLKSNQDKFSFMEDLFAEMAILTEEDFSQLLNENDEVVYFFIDEYSFKDVSVSNVKYGLMVDYIKTKINAVDEYMFSDLLDLAEKIKYWDIVKVITLFDKKDIRITSLLNFIERNITMMHTDYLKVVFNKLLETDLDKLNEFIVLFNINKLGAYSAQRAVDLIKLDDPDIQSRISKNKEYYQA